MTRPLRICFVAYRGNMNCGGQGIYLWFLARELARLGHDVDVVVGPPYPDPMPFARAVHRVPNDEFWAKWFLKDWAHFLPAERPASVLSPLRFYELAASRIGFFPEPFVFSVRALRELARRLRAGRRYDVVHDVQCLGWGLLGIRALGLPVVTTVHHPLTMDRRASFRRDRTLRDRIGTVEFHPVGMQGFVARHLDGVITSSRASAEQITDDFGVRPERLHMLGNGLDTGLFRPDPSQPRAPAELLCVGRAADPNKGVAVLVRALAKLPPHVRLTLVDDDHAEHGARKRARRLGVDDRLRIAGRVPVDELVRLYQRATLVVVPSLYEGFGLPAAEAMACGTPVVATRAGALPELMETAGGGVVVAPGDPDALAKGIDTLLEQPDSRARLGAAAPARIEAAYGWPRVAARTADVYRAVLAARRGRPANTTTSARSGRRPASASSA
ncbi:MAG: glycosyltransferase family 4 protein [Myxococcota bacterium]|nr:glycosyltransferase family 4 protein [Myxococcota bacterium]